MYYSKLKRQKFLIRLEIGESVNDSIGRFCRAQKIKNAWFACIGSIRNPQLYHYGADTKEYTKSTLKGAFEVTSLIGNVALFEGELLVHSHVNLSDQSMRAFGGHLIEAKVAAMLEIFLDDLGADIAKSEDAATGLKVFRLRNRLRA